jgi:hypothetical protein
MNASINDPGALHDSFADVSRQFTYFDEDTKNNILWGWANFEVEVMNEDSPYWNEALKMEKMQFLELMSIL